MATRISQDEIARRQAEQGERFLNQMGEMFRATRQDLAQQFMPRPEAEARMNHLDQVVESVGMALEKLTGNVSNFHESVPIRYADRAETKQDIAELRTEIEKLKTARESDMQRGYGMRIEDIQGRFKGDIGNERGWRTNAQQQNTQLIGWLIMGSVTLLTIAINIIVALAMRGH